MKEKLPDGRIFGPGQYLSVKYLFIQLAGGRAREICRDNRQYSTYMR